MEGSYLLEVYKRLTKAENTAFERYAQANLPPIGAGKPLALIRFLAEAAPDFAAEKVSKANVYRLIFPNEPFREGRLEKLMVLVVKQLKAYLLSQYYFREKNGFGRQLDWSIVLKDRGIQAWNMQVLTKLKRTPPPQFDRDIYHDLFRLEVEVCGEATSLNLLKGDLNVPQALQSLDLYYHISRLELLNHYLLQRRVTNLNHSQTEPFPWSNIPIPSQYLESSPVLLISHKISQLLRLDLPHMDDFQELAQLLQTHEKSITPDLLQQFFAYLRNLCAFLINAGAQNLLPVYHQLQRDNLERGYLYHDGQRITASAYLSVATGAIRVRNLEWALEFVESHKGKIIGDNEHADLYRLNKAQCLFAFGKFEEALDYIAPVFDFLNYALLAKRLEIKILYELQSSLLPYKAGAFKIFLTRASQKFLPTELRRPNADFVNIIHQILRSKPGQRGRSERLLQRVITKAHSAERDWLLEKVALLR
jgi:hypothetical protein